MGISPNTSLGAAVCRICHCGETSIPYWGASGGEPLISPCSCKGTMGLYHRSCLEHWLNLSRTTCCEICKFRFELETKYRSFWEFVKFRACHNEEEHGNVDGQRGDVTCFAVLTPFALGMSYICVAAALHNYDSEGHWRVPENIAMLTMAAFLLIIYTMWVSVTAAFYRSEYITWRNEYPIMVVVDQLSPNESLFFNGNRLSLPRRWLRKITAPASALTRLLRRRLTNGNNVITNNVAAPLFEVNVEPRYGSPTSTYSGPFAITPVDSFYAAGDNVEYPVNVYSESSEPLLGMTVDDTTMLDRPQQRLGPHRIRQLLLQSIAPIAVSSPRAPTVRPPVPQRQPQQQQHPSPPSLISSFTSTPPSATSAATTATVKSVTSISVSSGPSPLQQAEARTPLSDSLSSISRTPSGLSHGAAVGGQRSGSHVRATPLLTSTPSRRHTGSAAQRSRAASVATPDRLETQV